VLIASHKELEAKTKTGLSIAAAKAAEQAAEQDGATNLEHSGKLRDLASAAARIFGWDGDKGSAVTLNQVVVSPAQLEQIRALREPVPFETPRLDGPIQPFPHNPAGVADDQVTIRGDGGEVR
jgi:hypothetical protein